MSIVIGSIIKTMKSLGYKVFENDVRNYNLNIVGVRTKENIVNVFNDWLFVFWYHNGSLNVRQYTITTDPGLFYLENPLSKYGTAILLPGQYIHSHKFGYHKNDKSHEALIQCGSLHIARDFDRDDNLDIVNPDLSKCSIAYCKDEVGNILTEWYLGSDLVWRESNGYFGIDIHRAIVNNVITNVDKWSAGCQVFSVYDEYLEFIDIYKKSMVNFGDICSYTLLTEQQIDQYGK